MYLKTTKLLPVALGTGVLGFCLRLTLYRVGFDEKNILSATHPLHLVCLALTAFMALYLALAVRKLGGNNDPAANFPASAPIRPGMLLAAGFTAMYALTLVREVSAPINLIRTLLAFAAAGSMAVCALSPQRFSGLPTICWGIICAFFALDMLCRYQIWSGNPQLPDYVFQVLSCVLLCVCSYQRLAFDTGLGNRRALLFSGLMGLSLCLFCAAGPETRGFYLGGAFWSGACLCRFTPPAQTPEEEHDVPA